MFPPFDTYLSHYYFLFFIVQWWLVQNKFLYFSYLSTTFSLQKLLLTDSWIFTVCTLHTGHSYLNSKKYIFPYCPQCFVLRISVASLNFMEKMPLRYYKIEGVSCINFVKNFIKLCDFHPSLGQIGAMFDILLDL